MLTLSTLIMRLAYVQSHKLTHVLSFMFLVYLICCKVELITGQNWQQITWNGNFDCEADSAGSPNERGGEMRIFKYYQKCFGFSGGRAGTLYDAEYFCKRNMNGYLASFSSTRELVNMIEYINTTFLDVKVHQWWVSPVMDEHAENLRWSGNRLQYKGDQFIGCLKVINSYRKS